MTDDINDALPMLIGRDFIPDLVPVVDEDLGDGVNRGSDLKCYPRPRKRVIARKFDDIKKQAYVELIAKGGRRVETAKAVGVSWACVWMGFKEDPEFAEAVSIAETLANERVENAMYTAALDGDVKAQQTWLYNRWPERWKNERSINIDGKMEVKDDSTIDSKFTRLAERMLDAGE